MEPFTLSKAIDKCCSYLMALNWLKEVELQQFRLFCELSISLYLVLRVAFVEFVRFQMEQAAEYGEAAVGLQHQLIVAIRTQCTHQAESHLPMKAQSVSSWFLS